MVRVFTGNRTPQQAAADVAAEIEQFINADWIEPNEVAIVLQNFGQWGFPNVSFVDEFDEINAHVDWHDIQHLGQNPQLPYLQPWMTHGRAKVRLWMEQFLDAYSQQTYTPTGGVPTPLPIPARFHFDTEQVLTNCCDVNYVRILEALPLDDRWDDDGEPVMPFNLTLKDLYLQAKEDYDWPYESLRDALFASRDEGVNHEDNRPYFLWYMRLCQAARDYAMFDAAYVPIRQHWPAPLTPPLVSNYGDANTDGQRDSFGWYTTGGYTLDPASFNPTAANECIRGHINTRPHGDRYLPEHLDANGDYRSLWLVRPGVTSADFSAPYLYTYYSEHSSGNLNYYLPPGPLGTPPESLWDASLRNHRHWIESILNSAGGAPAAITPWVAMVGTTTEKTHQDPPPPYAITAEDCRRQLAMLRAKDIRELLLWWDSSTGQAQDWDHYQRIVDQVYTPSLDSYARLIGQYLGGGSDLDPDRLRYTLREGGDGFVTLRSFVPQGRPGQLALKATFTGMTPLPDARSVKLNLECAADTPDLRGQVYVWWQDDWRQVPIGDYPENKFGFFAPADANGWRDLRRTFTIPGAYVSGPTMDVKVVVQDTGLDRTFRVRFDLVQAYWTDEIDTADLSPQGADYNYSGSTTLADYTAFSADWSVGEPAADFNNDGAIDGSDMGDFINAYGNP